MARSVSLSHDTQKFLDTLGPKQYKQVVQKVFSLLANPEPNDSIQMQGFDGRRADIGEYRIVYRYDEGNVDIVAANKRNDDEIYKQVKRKR